MFVRLVKYNTEEVDGSPAKYVQHSDELIECAKVKTRKVDRKTESGTVKDLLLEMEGVSWGGDGYLGEQIPTDQSMSIYFMNNSGKTIDSIHLGR